MKIYVRNLIALAIMMYVVNFVSIAVSPKEQPDEDSQDAVSAWDIGVEKRQKEADTLQKELQANARAFAEQWVSETATPVDRFEYESTENGVHITRYVGWDSEVEIPAAIDGQPVTMVGDGAFAGNETITQVVVPDSVWQLNAGCFQDCPALETVYLSKNLYWLESSCFQGDTSLKNIIFTREDGKGCNIQYIGFRCFSGCISLQSIDLYSDTFPEVTIEEEAFQADELLQQIVFPQNMRILHARIFAECTALPEVNLPEGLEVIASGAFRSCTSMTQIAIPGTVNEIQEYAFESCSGLQNVIFAREETDNNNAGNGVIGRFAFINSGVSELNIPSKYGQIEYNVCENCLNLTAFRWYGQEENAEKSLGANPFQGCSKLQAIYLPRELKYIEAWDTENMPACTVYTLEGSNAGSFAASCGMNVEYVEEY